MEISTELLETIERYITYQLPDEQRREIDIRMEQDPDFRETVDALRRSRTAIDQSIRLDKARQQELIRMARTTMTQLDAQQPATVGQPAASLRKQDVFWRFAMAAVVLLLGGVFLVTSQVDLANADLDAGVHRDAMQTPEQNLRPAERQALDNFLSANALYTDGKFGDAVKLYERAANAPVSAYLKEAIWWNLSLACMKTGNLDKARQYWERYETIEQPHYPSSFIDRTRIKTQLFWRRLFA